MAEQVDLTVADQAKPGTFVYRIHYLMLDWQAKTITLALLGDNDVSKSCQWTGATATTMMRALNKVDLSVKSLMRRAYERAIADGLLPANATISGVPD